ncbi:barstar family protein [Actinopolymorpha alba]|uniref:barstar family protein n=1 Tax=Actinopolymorpha alba TaxID=533267 RepID=UPI0003603048|nr:barstar family protein [Actinopolymorpha alba]
MPELARLLAGERAPGVYWWPVAPGAEKLRVEAEDAGWRFVELDTTMVVDKAGLLDAIATTFGFPAYFGRTFDALADCLSDVRDEIGVLVLWEGWAALAELNPQTAGLALEVFGERAAEKRWGPFAVLVAGLGPELDIPTFE